MCKKEYIMNEFKTSNNNQVLNLKHQLLNQKIEVPILTYPILEETGIVKHCFSTREGGASKGIYASMNLSFTRGDDPNAVTENFKRMAQALDVKTESFVFSDQTHTTNVRRIYQKDKGKGLLKELDYHNVDGLITNERNITLATFYADCVPLYFVDPVHKAIGLSHSGWRGTVARMGEKTLKAMEKEFQTNPKDVICAIGPSICKDCYEVSGDVAEAFEKEFKEDSKLFIEDKKNGKYQLDLWEANRYILCKAGVESKHIAVTNICTCCNASLLFSHRATAGKRGNLGAFLALN